MGSADTPPEHPSERPREQSGHAARQHNLPASLTAFIGRDEEVAEVRRLLTTVRLLTLTGPPGVGKTRLALEVADGLADRYARGAWLVELAPLADPARVPQAVATALGVREQAGRPTLDLLADALRAPLLLVLDNCEHLIDACAALADALLHACPSLVILATSREPLGIAGETAWRVPSLTLPNLDEARAPGSGDPLAVAACSAVQLFVGRASAARPDFALTAMHAPAIARICHRLDGIPLALELAAARVMALSVEQIAERLDDRFRLLTGGNRTALPHQRTLRATVDWSYDLLSDPERMLFGRLAVFAGGWSLEAAEAVCAGADLDSSDVLDSLQHLVDRSLVVAETHPDGSNRFRMLEMLQQYAHERLAERGEGAEIRRQHAAYYLALAERAEGELRGPHEGEWSGRLESEVENLRLALRWLLERDEEHEDAERALRMSAALWRFWSRRGHLTEGLEWLERALAMLGSDSTSAASGESGTSSDALARARAGALNGAGNLAAARGEHARSAAFLEECLDLRRRLGDLAGEAIALHNLGTAARNLGDPALARARFDASLTLFRQLGDTTNAALSLLNLGRLSHDAGEYERATTLYGEGLALFQAVGSDHGVATAMNRLADLARDRGELAASEHLYREALALREGRGDPWVSGLSLTGLARVAARRGDFAATLSLSGQSLRALHEAGATRDAAAALVVAARAAGATGHAPAAARLLGAVARAYAGEPVIPVEREGFDRVVSTVRDALDAETFAAAWATGRQLTLDQAVDLALSLADSVPMPAPPAASEPPPPDAPPAASPPPIPPLEALTRREREVAGLIARGLTNRQIAEALVVSEMTADSHVSHILRKLGFRSRAQIASWAVQHGLRPPDPT